ncbi:unnamed protein product [Eruca vesicaria subsp. sativa]|uniref:RRM domain-containing protein n=1 Tax=Eruca vesicaria subsp. sativa TaxID=29727 RepID=A0ABC8KR55_ERUVS|nr:unnamed protein product [Eruca vesicaria subsp. sativa]
MAGDLFRRDRPFHQLDGLYTEWSEHLTKNCIPLFRQSQRSDVNNATVLRDIHSYYDTLDHYANKDTILYFLFPSWRSNSLETPILFLGDIHPRLFTDLIHSFIDQDPMICSTYSDLAAWEDLSLKLGDDINVTVSRLLGEMKGAQDGFVKRFSDKWVSSFLGSRSGTVVMETATSVTTDQDGGGEMIMEEFVRIFREANQLRKNTINSIVGVLDMNQLALFLESVCKFLAGFKHQDKAFHNSLFGNHPMNQQLASGEVIASHSNYPPHMMQQQYAAQLPPPNHTVPPMNQQQQTPEQVHVIYVGNLAPAATQELLRQIFSPYRSLRETKICIDKRGNKYGFVSFADLKEQRHAALHMNRKFFLGREMFTGLATKNSI